MKRITTATGSRYLLDSTPDRVKRLNGDNPLIGDGEWYPAPYMTEPTVGRVWEHLALIEGRTLYRRTSAIESIEDVSDEQSE